MVSTRRAAAAAGEKPPTTFDTPPDVRRAPRKRKNTATTPARVVTNGDTATRSPSADTTAPETESKASPERVPEPAPRKLSEQNRGATPTKFSVFTQLVHDESEPEEHSLQPAIQIAEPEQPKHGLFAIVATPIRRLFSPFRALRAASLTKPQSPAASTRDTVLQPPEAKTPSTAVRRPRPDHDEYEDQSSVPATEPPRKRQRMVEPAEPRTVRKVAGPRQSQMPEGFKVPVYTVGRKAKIRTEWEEELKKLDMRERGMLPPETPFEATKRENRQYHYEMLQRKFPNTTRYRARPEHSRWGVPAVFPGNKEDKDPWHPQFEEIRSRDYHITADHHRRDKVLRGTSHQGTEAGKAPEMDVDEANRSEQPADSNKKRKALPEDSIPPPAMKRTKAIATPHAPVTSSPLARSPLARTAAHSEPFSDMKDYPTPKVTNLAGSFAVPDSPISSSSEDEDDIPTPTKPAAATTAPTIAVSGIETDVTEFTGTISDPRMQAIVYKYMIGQVADNDFKQQIEDYADLLQAPEVPEEITTAVIPNGSVQSLQPQTTAKGTSEPKDRGMEPQTSTGATAKGDLRSLLKAQGARAELAELAMKAVQGLEGEDLDPLADLLEDPALF